MPALQSGPLLNKTSCSLNSVWHTMTALLFAFEQITQEVHLHARSDSLLLRTFVFRSRGWSASAPRRSTTDDITTNISSVTRHHAGNSRHGPGPTARPAGTTLACS